MFGDVLPFLTGNVSSDRFHIGTYLRDEGVRDLALPRDLAIRPTCGKRAGVGNEGGDGSYRICGNIPRNLRRLYFFRDAPLIPPDRARIGRDAVQTRAATGRVKKQNQVYRLNLKTSENKSSAISTLKQPVAIMFVAVDALGYRLQALRVFRPPRLPATEDFL
ncbi:hypothetical protein [Sinorhizobium meliloti]|uniref:hypothetical protein n=1 Tax=Rhizobium meliloti TaxID=382 RepID=UPI00129572E8|nr:hypothetical protein [Sinorhizobium meliloti]MQX70039.1 hypothetical protein [Sinorhizobium meliloti]